MKKTLTLDDVFIKQPTKSILNLLYEFPNKEKGLRPMEIRYALERDYEKKKSDDIEFVCNQRRAKELFGNYLNHLKEKGLIERDCINSGEHLNYYLEQLGSKKFNLIRKTGNCKKVRYKLENKMLKEFLRYRCKQAISISPADSIQEFEVRAERGVRHYFFGFSTEFMDKLKVVDKERIMNRLSAIEQKLLEIENIKFQLLCKEIEDRLLRFYRKTESERIKKLLNEYPQTFFFGLMELSGSEKIHNNLTADIWGDLFHLYEVKNKLPEANVYKLCVSWVNVLNEFREEEINEIKEWKQKNRDLLDLAVPLSLSFFRYNYGDIKFYHS